MEWGLGCRVATTGCIEDRLVKLGKELFNPNAVRQLFDHEVKSGANKDMGNHKVGLLHVDDFSVRCVVGEVSGLVHEEDMGARAPASIFLAILPFHIDR